MNSLQNKMEVMTNPNLANLITMWKSFYLLSNFVEDHPRNIPAKFGSNWPNGFREEA
jgi:hypothetical protein